LQNTKHAAQDKKRAPETVAILYRTNAQSRPIEQALIERQIPYRIHGGLKFYERREIKDLIAALRFAANPNDSVSRERLDKTFTKTVLRPLLEILHNASASRPVELIGSVLETTRYAEYAKKNLTNVEDRMENIAELLRFASEFDDLATFLERIALVQSTDDSARTAGELPVALMTIHLAKGLEFDRVFIAGCAEGLLPHGRALGSDAELEEERRLMYVAMTRARHELAISFYDIPSRFLSELPSDKLMFTSLTGDGTDRPFDDEERYISYD
jgi:DNA helicase-2/ATP-dependent DNA helicase PcrA